MKCFECGSDASVVVKKQFESSVASPAFNPFKAPDRVEVELVYCRKCFEEKVKP